MPPNDGGWSDDDHRIAPIEESGEQCEADASRVIHASGLMPRARYRASCLRRTRFSARSAPDERTNNASRLSRSETIPTIARANCSMRSSCQSRPAFAGVRRRRGRGANYCGPHAGKGHRNRDARHRRAGGRRDDGPLGAAGSRCDQLKLAVACRRSQGCGTSVRRTAARNAGSGSPPTCSVRAITRPSASRSTRTVV
jgi:hypothetical protein